MDASDSASKSPAELQGIPASIFDFLSALAGQSAYLRRLVSREQNWLERIIYLVPDEVLNELLAPQNISLDELLVLLRIRKRRIALLTALCDLGGVWSLDQVTQALTKFADFACDSLLRAVVSQYITRGHLPGNTPWHGNLVFLAMGKMGAFELNYSSDIDLIALISDAAPQDTYPQLIKSVRAVAQGLSGMSDEGYVFRTDLRLRPDASSTPAAVSMAFARRYYPDHGRSWERAAHIKARPAAGDKAAGAVYLEGLQSWIFRRQLDFAAIEDAHGMLRTIRNHKGLSGPITVPGHDLKLGRGGIREIEFFTQAQQLISAGRHPDLRQAGTVSALKALADAGWVEPAAAKTLCEIYPRLRDLEHRVQMLEDAQTHRLPAAPEIRRRVAALSGYNNLAEFDELVQADLEAVHQIVEGAIARNPVTKPGNIARPPKQDPISSALSRWASLPVARSERAAQTYARVAPLLGKAISGHARPKAALAGFDRFISGLGSGVQLLSALETDAHAREILVDLLASSPRHARLLAQRPAILDPLFEPGFLRPERAFDDFSVQLGAALAAAQDLEQILDAVRRVHREAAFRLDVQTLHGVLSLSEASVAYSDIAQKIVAALLPAVIEDLSRRYGPPPGGGLAVLALGKLGTREMTATSDLDLILIYDPGDGVLSDGPGPLSPEQYYARLARSFTTALTVLTAEGPLYEVDMRLRPSGRQGPVAVPIRGFRRYQLKDAWTWEHMALSRGRIVAGHGGILDAVEDVLKDLRSMPRSERSVLSDLTEMRLRLAQAHPHPFPHDYKRGAGRLLDIDLFLQAGLLITKSVFPATGDAFDALAENGFLHNEDAEHLKETRFALMQAQAADRLLLGGEKIRPEATLPMFDILLKRQGGFAKALPELSQKAAQIIDRHML